MEVATTNSLAGRLTLPHKPGAEIAYRLIRIVPSAAQEDGPHVLIVFINGLMLPMSGWEAAINLLLQDAKIKDLLLSLLTYDRYGQGQTTDRDPTDDPSDLSHGHDILSSVTDLHHLLTAITTAHFSTAQPPLLLFVAHSIGVPLARLYCTRYPGTISALLLLASNIANTDFLSIFPDPSSPPPFPPGVSHNDLLALRQRLSQTFHPNVGSAEGLSRRNLPALLPHSNL